MREARYYAYSIDGPRSAPHCFDPDKVLFDPYARSLFFPPGFDREAAITAGPNAGRAPLGLLAADAPVFDWAKDPRPRHETDTVVYELHVRGFTAHPSSAVLPARRGTFAGLADKIPYLKALGATVIELMPVFQFDPHEGNYWGYMPLGFFAPHHGWACARESCDQHNEFRTLVRALHAAGLEVVLDVVYNHTGEGGQAGPVYSFKGIDSDTYYLVSGRPGAAYENFSGTGNSLNCGNPYVRKMILDSMRY
jgi:glycogen operon protein